MRAAAVPGKRRKTSFGAAATRFFSIFATKLFLATKNTKSTKFLESACLIARSPCHIAASLKRAPHDICAICHFWTFANCKLWTIPHLRALSREIRNVRKDDVATSWRAFFPNFRNEVVFSHKEHKEHKVSGIRLHYRAKSLPHRSAIEARASWHLCHLPFLNICQLQIVNNPPSACIIAWSPQRSQRCRSHIVARLFSQFPQRSCF